MGLNLFCFLKGSVCSMVLSGRIDLTGTLLGRMTGIFIVFLDHAAKSKIIINNYEFSHMHLLTFTFLLKLSLFESQH